MTPQFRNPFKPSKSSIFSMLVSKITSMLNHSLTIRQFKQLHALVLINGLNHLEPVLITQIIAIPSNYSQTVSHYLQSLLHHAKHPDAFSRTSAIQDFYRHGRFREARAEFVHMQRTGLVPTTFTVASALKACVRLGDRIGGVTIHGQVHGYGFCGNVHVGTALVGFYTKFDDMVTAKRVFDEMSERNTASFVIDRYLESGNPSMAERLFHEMPNKDIASWNSMISGYTKTGRMEKAVSSFGSMPVKNPASWDAMIRGYVDSDDMEIARNFYDVMPEPSIVSAITMIRGYSRHGAVESARELFDETGVKTPLLYDAMIACCAENTRLEDALQLFDEMLQPNADVKPDSKTLATVISICCQLGDFRFGVWIEEALMKQMGITMEEHLLSALIDLHAKCGNVDRAYMLFHDLQKRDVGMYTTMILACGRHGRKDDVIKLFEEMLEANICPNLVTFSGLLSALNQVGTVNSASPSPPLRSLDRSGMVEERFKRLPPYKHMARVEESYCGFKTTSNAYNHVVMFEESYHRFRCSSSIPPYRVEESYQGRSPVPHGIPYDVVEESYLGC